MTCTSIIVYHQTHYIGPPPQEYVSLLPLLEECPGVTHVILAAIHINDNPAHLTLNDDLWSHEKNDFVWQEMQVLQSSGIKVLGMLGGAAKGSFRRLDGDRASFLVWYEPLRQMIQTVGLDGLDLDVEEHMSLSGIIRLIDQLKHDFGASFIITLAPVATALQGQRHLSGFDYEALEKAMGRHIAWYNTQFYCGWGSVEDTRGYDEIMRRGWPAEKVVLGLITNPESGAGWVPDEILQDTILALRARYPSFGGVMGWEVREMSSCETIQTDRVQYFNSITAAEPFGWPWSWASLMTKILKPELRHGDHDPMTQQTMHSAAAS